MRVMVIGETDTVSKSLQDKLKEVEETTKANSDLNWKLAVCYGGTRDIVQATRKLCNKAKAGLIEPEDVDEALMSRELWTAGDTDPDLLIRTGGNVRISNYLMWQLAQTELFFTNIHAPEFEEAHFIQALATFQQRNRTFGK